MTLIEDELYVYDNKENEKHSNLYVISGCFVKILNSKDVTASQTDLRKVYPLEIYLGGRTGSLRLYFDSREI